MIKKSFKNLTKGEWILLVISIVVVLVSNVMADGNIITTFGTVLGASALVFVAKGDVLGQFMLIVFCFLYAVVSFKMKYYGEMITYLGMSMPAAIAATVSWLKNPYSKERNEVKISKLRRKQKAIVGGLSVIVTWAFYYILKFLGTENLLFSTLSVATSLFASLLVFYRSSYYALGYMANDIVIIVLWILATIKDFSYFPMIACFVMFFVNDTYGFISWRKREKNQNQDGI